MSPEARSRWSWTVLRLTLAGLLAAHGWARWLAGGVAPFGGWLEGQGFPLGLALAWGITLFEILATPVFAAGRLVFPLSLAFAALYTVGIVLVHAPAGWFVVGLGRNGAEYSVLLIVALLCVGVQGRGLRKPA
jgi:putative oxidoreductase